MILYENEYRTFIESRGVGQHDKVASSVESYVSYLRSVSKGTEQYITPQLIASEERIEEIAQSLVGKYAAGTINNCKSAMRQYLAFAKVTGHLNELGVNGVR